MDKLLHKLFTKTQEELLTWLPGFLSSQRIPFKIIDENVVSIKNSTSPIFCAHMDTVDDMDMKKPLLLHPKTNILSRKDGILGADDRAGMYLIMKHADKINFIFTRDEECGGIGSGILCSNKNVMDSIQDNPCMIVLDRRNYGDIIGVSNSYCNNDLQIDVRDCLGDLNYKSSVGSFSDANLFAKFIPCVNLSVGYFNPHTDKEYLDLNHIEKMLPFIPKLSDALLNTYSMPDYKNKFNYNYGVNYDLDDWDSNYNFTKMKCCICDLYCEDFYSLAYDKFICRHCAEDVVYTVESEFYQER